MTNIQTFTFNGFQENTYVIDDGKNCVIIDPGCYEKHEVNALFSHIESNHLTPQAVLLTHGHIDHVLGCYEVLKKYDVDFYLHSEDIVTLDSVANYADMYGFPAYTAPKKPTHLLKGGEQLSFGNIHFEVKFAPGHAPGHVVYYNKEEQYVINGDVLFQGSFGRTDLPGGDMETLKKTIHEIMFVLPDATKVYCGHGPSTTIGVEKQTNYILNF